ncbi:Rieske (2Fe-2S) protein [Cohnella cellulosilytica]|uniref:Rieske (2Fe-2S) protein n=1 Tax=Cohnella cellulosilytica TaxID=986710 RepID=A0ABW2F9S1_9BACL
MNDEPYPIDLGPAAAYAALPAEVTVDGTPYWLVRGSGGEYRLLMAVCPHAGGDIRPHENVFYCPLHFWTFHGETGACLNDPDHGLINRGVVVRDDRLYATANPG